MQFPPWWFAASADAETKQQFSGNTDSTSEQPV
jgi:hypothetical protein